jgi:hypothetical protein
MLTFADLQPQRRQCRTNRVDNPMVRKRVKQGTARGREQNLIHAGQKAVEFLQVFCGLIL